MVRAVTARALAWFLRVSLGLGASLGLLGCGDRTGLLVPTADLGYLTSELDAGEPPADAMSRGDGGRDATEEDAAPDAPPPPVVVSPPRPTPNDCPDAGATLIYLIAESGNLMSFYPPTASFKTIGLIACSAPPNYTPFSMGVDHTGIAYVLFIRNNIDFPNDFPSHLFRVSTATASCRATSFVSGQQGFTSTFGMGFSANTVGSGETLYVASDQDPDGGVPQLGTIDTTTFELRVVGNLPPQANKAELTGTGAGDLFGFYGAHESSDSADSLIGQINRSNARIAGQSTLTGVSQGQGWAFAFWGGDFYTFTSPRGSNNTNVTRFRPSDGSIVQVAQTPAGVVIVGAGVSTCAPQQ